MKPQHTLTLDDLLAQTKCAEYDRGYNDGYQDAVNSHKALLVSLEKIKAHCLGRRGEFHTIAGIVNEAIQQVEWEVR